MDNIDKGLALKLQVAEERAEKAELELEQAQKQWRCYHCDEVFTDPVLAAEHFGDDRENPRPARCERLLAAISEAFERYGVHRNHHNAASVKLLGQRAEQAEREWDEAQRRLKIAEEALLPFVDLAERERDALGLSAKCRRADKALAAIREISK